MSVLNVFEYFELDQNMSNHFNLQLEENKDFSVIRSVIPVLGPLHFSIIFLNPGLSNISRNFQLSTVSSIYQYVHKKGSVVFSSKLLKNDNRWWNTVNIILAATQRRCNIAVASSDCDSAYVSFNTKSKSKCGHFVKYAKSLSRCDCYATPMRRSRQ